MKGPADIVWTAEAIEDLKRIQQAVEARHGQDGVRRLKSTLKNILELIQRFPLIGMATPDRPRLRKLHLNNFHRIVYEPRETVIVIHAILPYWMVP